MLIASAESSDGGFEFHPPSIFEFFPPELFGFGPIVFNDQHLFGMTRINIAQLIATAVVVILLIVGTRRMSIVPGRLQSIVEMGFDFVGRGIATDLLGRKDGERFKPLLLTIFFMVLFMNLTGIVPGINIAGTSVIAVPLMLALISYVTFIYAGIKKSPKGFFKNALFPSGVPPFLYIIVTPLEFLSTFIIRPVTLTLRLLMNMMVGHLMLVLLFSATWSFTILAPAAGQAGFVPLGIGTLAFGFVFTLFELLVAFLQAYVFTILTALYIQLAVAEEH
ncbi:F0F1 ATP synthase subunit A [Microbacterium stercoris]|uniref:ATP synthase subunit a n=1 Tax=Microbacterium stercoris TaxID=2820289 RepID=A0A939QI36_9MICO|nr:F0F1 ATP synthase subunit A [Microbacterium stercoris]MBO3663258.1 F0F1 ATP synthase subunit A [Microbacterium stercoris]